MFAILAAILHIKLCPIVRLAKAKTMVDSNLAAWEFAADLRVILVLLSARVGRLSVVTIFTFTLPHGVVICHVWFQGNTNCEVGIKQGRTKPWEYLAVLDNIIGSSLVKTLAVVSVRSKCSLTLDLSSRIDTLYPDFPISPKKQR